MDLDKMYIKFNNYEDRDSITVEQFIDMVANKVMEKITKPEKVKPKKRISNG